MVRIIKLIPRNPEIPTQLFIVVDCKFSYINTTFRIDLGNKEIFSVIGVNLLTSELRGSIEEFIYNNIFDRIGLVFFESMSMYMYLFMFLLLLTLNHQQMHLYFSTLFHSFILLLIPIKFDPSTERIKSALLSPLLSYDFPNIIMPLPLSSFYLPVRFHSTSISSSLLANLAPLLVIWVSFYLLLQFLRLQVLAHFTRKRLDLISLLFLNLHMYLDLTGLWNTLRLVYPQIVFFCLLVVRNYADNEPPGNALFGAIGLVFAVAVLVRLWILCSYEVEKARGAATHGGGQTGREGIKDDKNRDKGKKRSNKKGGRKKGKLLEAEEEKDEDSQSKDIVNEEDLFDIEKMRANPEIAKLLGLHSVDITLQSLEKTERDNFSNLIDLDEHLIMKNYNLKYYFLFSKMRIELYWVRIYPFLDLLHSILISTFILIYNEKTYATTQAFLIFLVESIYCIGSSALKPYRDNKENILLIFEKSSSLAICVLIALLSIDDQRYIFGKSVRVRLIERSMLYGIIWIKVLFTFSFFTWKSIASLISWINYYSNDGRKLVKEMNKSFLGKKEKSQNPKKKPKKGEPETLLSFDEGPRIRKTKMEEIAEEDEEEKKEAAPDFDN